MADEQSAAATIEEPAVQTVPDRKAGKKEKTQATAPVQRHPLERQRPHLQLRHQHAAKALRPSRRKRHATRQPKSTPKAASSFSPPRANMPSSNATKSRLRQRRSHRRLQRLHVRHHRARRIKSNLSYLAAGLAPRTCLRRPLRITAFNPLAV